MPVAEQEENLRSFMPLDRSFTQDGTTGFSSYFFKLKNITGYFYMYKLISPLFFLNMVVAGFVLLMATENSHAQLAQQPFCGVLDMSTEDCGRVQSFSFEPASLAWRISTATFDRGGSSLRSPQLSDNQNACFHIALTAATRPLRLDYFRQLDTEEVAQLPPAQSIDSLRLLADGVLITRSAGLLREADSWLGQQRLLPALASTLSFCYSKNTTGTSGSDSIWIDSLSFGGDSETPLSEPPTFCRVLDMSVADCNAISGISMSLSQTFSQQSVQSVSFLVTTGTRFAGASSVASPILNRGESACLHLTVSQLAPGSEIRFRWRLNTITALDDSIGRDRFHFSGTDFDTPPPIESPISTSTEMTDGTVNWLTATAEFTGSSASGNTPLQWCFSKNLLSDNLFSRGWLDQLSIDSSLQGYAPYFETVPDVVEAAPDGSYRFEVVVASLISSDTAGTVLDVFASGTRLTVSEPAAAQGFQDSYSLDFDSSELLQLSDSSTTVVRRRGTVTVIVPASNRSGGTLLLELSLLPQLTAGVELPAPRQVYLDFPRSAIRNICSALDISLDSCLSIRAVSSRLPSGFFEADPVRYPWRFAAEGLVDNDSLTTIEQQADNEVSCLTMDVELSAAARINFHWQVSSEAGSDSLQFFVNDQLFGTAISGQTGWLVAQHIVLQPSSSLSWCYIKDSLGTVAMDRGWLDNVDFNNLPSIEPAIAVSAAAGELADATGTVVFDVTARLESSAINPPPNLLLLVQGINNFTGQLLYPLQFTGSTAVVPVRSRLINPDALTARVAIAVITMGAEPAIHSSVQFIDLDLSGSVLGVCRILDLSAKDCRYINGISFIPADRPWQIDVDIVRQGVDSFEIPQPAPSERNCLSLAVNLPADSQVEFSLRRMTPTAAAPDSQFFTVEYLVDGISAANFSVPAPAGDSNWRDHRRLGNSAASRLDWCYTGSSDLPTTHRSRLWLDRLNFGVASERVEITDIQEICQALDIDIRQCRFIRSFSQLRYMPGYAVTTLNLSWSVSDSAFDSFAQGNSALVSPEVAYNERICLVLGFDVARVALAAFSSRAAAAPALDNLEFYAGTIAPANRVQRTVAAANLWAAESYSFATAASEFAWCYVNNDSDRFDSPRVGLDWLRLNFELAAEQLVCEVLDVSQTDCALIQNASFSDGQDWLLATVSTIGQTSLQTPALNIGEQQCLTLAVDTLPAATEIEFNWRIDSTTADDRFRFFINSAVQISSISGQTDWRQEIYTAGTPVTELSWCFIATTATVTTGTTYLDGLSFNPPLQSLELTIEVVTPPEQSGIVGDFDFDVEVATARPAGGLDLSQLMLQVSAADNIASADNLYALSFVDGVARLDISVRLADRGSDGAVQLSLMIPPALSIGLEPPAVIDLPLVAKFLLSPQQLCEVLDIDTAQCSTAYSVTPISNAAIYWSVADEQFLTGGSSARSPALGANQRSCLLWSFTTPQPAPQWLSYSYFIDSSTAGNLELSVNGGLQPVHRFSKRSATAASWQQAGYLFGTADLQQVTWCFTKDSDPGNILDRVYIDRVSVTTLSDTLLNPVLYTKNDLCQTLDLSPGDCSLIASFSHTPNSQPWLISDQTSITGGTSAHSDTVGTGQRSCLNLQLTAAVPGSSQLSFHWRAEASAVDTVTFLLNGRVVRTLNGVTGWQAVQLPEALGASADLSWCYNNNGLVSELPGERLLLDNLSIEPLTQRFAPTVVAVSEPVLRSTQLQYFAADRALVADVNYEFEQFDSVLSNNFSLQVIGTDNVAGITTVTLSSSQTRVQVVIQPVDYRLPGSVMLQLSTRTLALPGVDLPPPLQLRFMAAQLLQNRLLCTAWDMSEFDCEFILPATVVATSWTFTSETAFQGDTSTGLNPLYSDSSPSCLRLEGVSLPPGYSASDFNFSYHSRFILQTIATGNMASDEISDSIGSVNNRFAASGQASATQPWARNTVSQPFGSGDINLEWCLQLGEARQDRLSGYWIDSLSFTSSQIDSICTVLDLDTENCLLIDSVSQQPEDRSWTASSAFVVAGSNSLQAPDTPANDRSCLNFQLTLNAGQRINYYGRITSLSGEATVEFLVDGQPVNMLTENSDGQNDRYQTDAAVSSLSWCWSPGATVDSGDGFWLDSLSFSDSQQLQEFCTALDLSAQDCAYIESLRYEALQSEGWTETPATAVIGDSSLQSPEITDAQRSCVHLQLSPSETSYLRYRYRFSSDSAANRLTVTVNGSEVDNLSGGSDWRQNDYRVNAVLRSLSFCYNRNLSGLTTAARAGLDQLQFVVPLTLERLCEVMDVSDDSCALLQELTFEPAAAGWEVTEDTAQTGNSSLRSPLLGDGESSCLSLSLSEPLLAGSTLAYARRVSSQASRDFLSLNLGESGLVAEQISGEFAWAPRQNQLDSAIDRLSWCYTKDGSGKAGSDRAWIDSLELVPEFPFSVAQLCGALDIDASDCSLIESYSFFPLDSSWQIIVTTDTTAIHAPELAQGQSSCLLLNTVVSSGYLVVYSAVLEASVDAADTPDQLEFKIDPSLAPVHQLSGSGEGRYIQATDNSPLVWCYQKNSPLVAGRQTPGLDRLELNAPLSQQQICQTLDITDADCSQIQSITFVPPVLPWLITTATSRRGGSSLHSPPIDENQSSCIRVAFANSAFESLQYFHRIESQNNIFDAGIADLTVSINGMRRTDLRIAGLSLEATNWSPVQLQPIRSPLTWCYAKTVDTDPVGADRAWLDGFEFERPAADELCQILDIDTVSCQTIAAAGFKPVDRAWQSDSAVSLSGGSSLRVLPSPNEINHCLVLSVPLAEGTVVSYNYRQSIEEGETPPLQLLLDGQAVAQQLSTAGIWHQAYSLPVTTPVSTVAWCHAAADIDLWLDRVVLNDDSDVTQLCDALDMNAVDCQQIELISLGSDGQQWQVSELRATVGNTALQSPDLPAGQVASCLELSVDLPGAGYTLSYQRRSELQSGNFVVVLLNGEERTRFIGNFPVWVTAELPLPSGNFGLQWCLNRVTDSGQGEDAFWLDALRFNLPASEQSVVCEVLDISRADCDLIDSVRYDPPDSIWQTDNRFAVQGNSSLRAPEVADGESSCLIIALAPTTTVSVAYQRRVSSQPDSDFIGFYSGAQQRLLHRFDGQRDWQSLAVSIDTDNPVFSWCYVKDAQDSAGDDSGWLDAVRFAPESLSPTAVCAALDLSVAGCADINAVTSVGPGWQVSARSPFSAPFALRSPQLDAGQRSCVQLHMDEAWTGWLEFYWQLESTAAGQLQFVGDFDLGLTPLLSVQNAEPDTGWQRYSSYPPTENVAAVSWCYRADPLQDSPSGLAGLDALRFAPVADGNITTPERDRLCLALDLDTVDCRRIVSATYTPSLPWLVVSTASAQVGMTSLATPLPSASDVACLQLEVILPQSTAVSFYWQVDSRPVLERFEFAVNGIVQIAISGPLAVNRWSQQQRFYTAGVTSLSWCLSGNFDGDAAAVSRAWLDGLDFGIGEPPPLTSKEQLCAALDLDASSCAAVSAFTQSPDSLRWQLNSDLRTVGDRSLASPIAVHGESACLSLQVLVPAPAQIFWDWRVDSDPEYDQLQFLVNGIIVDEISGTRDWQRRSYSSPVVDITDLSWCYSKDQFNSFGSDRGWVDNVLIVFDTVAKATVCSVLDLSQSDCEAIDSVTFTPSESEWVIASDTGVSGGRSLQSPLLNDGQRSCLTLTMNIDRLPERVDFHWRVDSRPVAGENGDVLQFAGDAATSEVRTSGLLTEGNDWRLQQRLQAGGFRTLSWCYSRSSTDSTGQRRGWLDALSFYRGNSAQLLPDRSAVCTALALSPADCSLIAAFSQYPPSLSWLEVDDPMTGTPALRSPALSHSETSCLRLSLAVPLQPDYRVDLSYRIQSEDAFDIFDVYFLDSNDVASRQQRISGTATAALAIAQSTATGDLSALELCYSKNQTVHIGTDAVWLSSMDLSSTAAVPLTISAVTAPVQNLPGGPFTFAVTVSAQPLQPGLSGELELQVRGLDNVVTVDYPLRLTAGSGLVSVIVTLPDGNRNGSLRLAVSGAALQGYEVPERTLTLVPDIDARYAHQLCRVLDLSVARCALIESLEQTVYDLDLLDNLLPDTVAIRNWTVSDALVSSGTAALHSAAVDELQSSCLELQLSPGAVAAVRFDWRIEANDARESFAIYLENQQPGDSLGGISADWQTRSLQLGQNNRLMWCFNRSFSLAANSGRGWLDRLQLEPVMPLPTTATTVAVEQICMALDMSAADCAAVVDLQSGDGTANWSITANEMFSGSSSLQSPALAAGQSSCLQLELNLPTPLLVEFQLQTDTIADRDQLEYRVNNQRVFAVGGSRTEGYDWFLQQRFISAQTSTPVQLSWCFNRAPNQSVDLSVSDRVWLDTLRFTRGIASFITSREALCAMLQLRIDGISDRCALITSFSQTPPSLSWQRLEGVAFQRGATAARPDQVLDVDFSDALESPTLVDGETACLTVELQLDAPSRVEFLWGTDSEGGADFLQHYIDDQLQLRTSGSIAENNGLQAVSFFHPAPPQYFYSRLAARLRWCYAKNQSVSIGRDRVWIDRVGISTGAAVYAPSISTLGTFSAIATPLTDSIPEICDAFSMTADSCAEVLGVQQSPPSLRWQQLELVTRFGFDNETVSTLVLQPALAHEQRSCLDLAVDLPPGSIVRFNVGYRSEPNDFGEFLVDGQRLERFAGTIPRIIFAPRRYELVAGASTLSWCAEKDARGTTDFAGQIGLLLVDPEYFRINDLSISRAPDFSQPFSQRNTVCSVLDIDSDDCAAIRSIAVDPATNTWVVTDQTASRGEFSLSSPVVADNEQSCFRFTVELQSPLRVEFYWRSDSSYVDRLIFSVDGVQQLAASGIAGNGNNWQPYQFYSAQAVTTLSWCYRKDTSGRAGSDRVWVDQLRFITGDVAQLAELQNVCSVLDMSAEDCQRIDAVDHLTGDLPWRIDTAVGYDSPASMRSGTIVNGGRSCLELNLALPADSQVEFNILSDVAVAEPLSFAINGNEVFSIDDQIQVGEINLDTRWKRYRAYSSTPVSRISWCYSRIDDGRGRARNSAWLDRLAFVIDAPSAERLPLPRLCAVLDMTAQNCSSIAAARHSGNIHLPWTVTELTANRGVDSLLLGTVRLNQSSCLELSVSLPAATEIRFALSLRQSPAFHLLDFSVNDAMVHNFTDVFLHDNWAEFRWRSPAAVDSLQWCYRGITLPGLTYSGISSAIQNGLTAIDSLSFRSYSTSVTLVRDKQHFCEVLDMNAADCAEIRSFRQIVYEINTFRPNGTPQGFGTILTTTERRSWRVSSDFAVNGGTSLVTPDLSPGELGCIEMELDLPAPNRVDYYWQSDSNEVIYAMYIDYAERFPGLDLALDSQFQRFRGSFAQQNSVWQPNSYLTLDNALTVLAFCYQALPLDERFGLNLQWLDSLRFSTGTAATALTDKQNFCSVLDMDSADCDRITSWRYSHTVPVGSAWTVTTATASRGDSALRSPLRHISATGSDELCLQLAVDLPEPTWIEFDWRADLANFYNREIVDTIDFLLDANPSFYFTARDSRGRSIALRRIKHGAAENGGDWYRQTAYSPGGESRVRTLHWCFFYNFGGQLYYHNPELADAGWVDNLSFTSTLDINSEAYKSVLCDALDMSVADCAAVGAFVHSPREFPWRVTTATAALGEYSLISNSTEADNGGFGVFFAADPADHPSCLTLQLNLPAPVRIEFYWRSNSLTGQDRLEYFVNGASSPLFAAGGTPGEGNDWRRQQRYSGERVTQLSWCLGDNSIVKNFGNRVWIDGLRFIRGSQAALPTTEQLCSALDLDPQLCNAVDRFGYSNSSLPWQLSTDTVNVGELAVRSPIAAHDEETCLSMLFIEPLPAASRIEFDFLIDAEAGDQLRFEADGSLQLSAAGTTGTAGWQRHRSELSEPLSELRWCYVKDSQITAGADRVWIDNLQIQSGISALSRVDLCQTLDLSDSLCTQLVDFAFEPLHLPWHISTETSAIGDTALHSPTLVAGEQSCLRLDFNFNSAMTGQRVLDYSARSSSDSSSVASRFSFADQERKIITAADWQIYRDYLTGAATASLRWCAERLTVNTASEVSLWLDNIDIVDLPQQNADLMADFCSALDLSDDICQLIDFAQLRSQGAVWSVSNLRQLTGDKSLALTLPERGEQSCLTLPFLRPLLPSGELQFGWRLDQYPPPDSLSFAVNNDVQPALILQVTNRWHRESYRIESPLAELRWCFSRELHSPRSTRAWLDSLSFDFPLGLISTVGRELLCTVLDLSVSDCAAIVKISRTSTDEVWHPTDQTASKGLFSLRSPVLDDGQGHCLSVELQLPAGAVGISFYWRADTQPGDQLEFRQETPVIFAASGALADGNDWQQREFYFAAGVSTVSWCFNKDGSGSANSDAVWIDRVEFITGQEVMAASVPETVCRVLDMSAEDCLQIRAVVQSADRVPWLIDSNIANSGTDSLRSAPNTSGRESCLVLETGIPVGSRIEFYWRGDTTAANQLTFRVDNFTHIAEAARSIDGDSADGWILYSFQFLFSPQRLTWCYTNPQPHNNDSLSAVWLDSLKFVDNDLPFSVTGTSDLCPALDMDAEDCAAIQSVSEIGSASWKADTVRAYRGNESVQSRLLSGQSGLSCLTLDVNLPAQTEISFAFTHDSQYDFAFWLNFVMIFNFEPLPAGSWSTYTFQSDQPVSSLLWCTRRAVSDTINSGLTGIDSLSFTRSPPPTELSGRQQFCEVMDLSADDCAAIRSYSETGYRLSASRSAGHILNSVETTTTASWEVTTATFAAGNSALRSPTLPADLLACIALELQLPAPVRIDYFWQSDRTTPAADPAMFLYTGEIVPGTDHRGATQRFYGNFAENYTFWRPSHLLVSTGTLNVLNLCYLDVDTPNLKNSLNRQWLDSLSFTSGVDAAPLADRQTLCRVLDLTVDDCAAITAHRYFDDQITHTAWQIEASPAAVGGSALRMPALRSGIESRATGNCLSLELDLPQATLIEFDWRASLQSFAGSANEELRFATPVLFTMVATSEAAVTSLSIVGSGAPEAADWRTVQLYSDSEQPITNLEWCLSSELASLFFGGQAPYLGSQPPYRAWLDNLRFSTAVAALPVSETAVLCRILDMNVEDCAAVLSVSQSFDNRPWLQTTAVAVVGASSLQSGVVDTAAACLNLQLDLPLPVQVAFYWRTDSASTADILEYRVNGRAVPLFIADGSSVSDNRWSLQQRYNETVISEISWCVRTDRPVSTLSSRFWLDGLRFVRGDAAQPAARPQLCQALDIAPSDCDEIDSFVHNPASLLWQISTAVINVGAAVLQSPTVQNGESACFSLVPASSLQPALQLAFDFMLDTGSGNSLYFYANDQLLFTADGGQATGWQSKTLQIDQPLAELRWCYVRDRQFSTDSDRVWIDNLRLTSGIAALTRDDLCVALDLGIATCTALQSFSFEPTVLPWRVSTADTTAIGGTALGNPLLFPGTRSCLNLDFDFSSLGAPQTLAYNARKTAVVLDDNLVLAVNGIDYLVSSGVQWQTYRTVLPNTNPVNLSWCYNPATATQSTAVSFLLDAAEFISVAADPALTNDFCRALDLTGADCARINFANLSQNGSDWTVSNIRSQSGDSALVAVPPAPGNQSCLVVNLTRPLTQPESIRFSWRLDQSQVTDSLQFLVGTDTTPRLTLVTANEWQAVDYAVESTPSVLAWCYSRSESSPRGGSGWLDDLRFFDPRRIVTELTIAVNQPVQQSVAGAAIDVGMTIAAFGVNGIMATLEQADLSIVAMHNIVSAQSSITVNFANGLATFTVPVDLLSQGDRRAGAIYCDQIH